ncbi:MAG: hypothetical protein PF447_08435 [Spirochaetaceae bacterium]|jgi:hypothetical protein|nr:hypothetical protein [Spirochaetaceae bacterium]
MNNDFTFRNFYRVDEDQRIVYLDLNLESYREIYNVWDFSPLINRDLDDDLFEYIQESAKEIPPKYKINLILHLPRGIKNSEKEILTDKGFRNYFLYEIRKQRNLIQGNLRRARGYALLGLLLLLLTSLGSGILENLTLGRVLLEGLAIGGWVLFWEFFSALFFHNGLEKKRLKILYRLKDAPILFQYKEK